MTEFIISNIFGLIIGFVTSFISWCILFHGIVPKIQYSKKISKFSRPTNAGIRYRIKFQNSGWRDVIDINLIGILSIEGLDRKLPHNTFTFHIPIGASNIPNLPRSRSGVQRFLLDKVDDISLFPPNIRDKFQNQTLQLEDLLSLGTHASIKVHALGYDSFSGSRKLFTSPSYTLDDIGDGPYEKDSLKLKQRVET